MRFRNQLDDLEDPGLYWYLQYRDGLGQEWSIDTWLLERDHPLAMTPYRFAQAMSEKLDDDLRRTILEIKHRSLLDDLDSRGIDVYKAVLRDGIETYDGFRNWLERNPAEGLERWVP